MTQYPNQPWPPQQAPQAASAPMPPQAQPWPPQQMPQAAPVPMPPQPAPYQSGGYSPGYAPGQPLPVGMPPMGMPLQFDPRSVQLRARDENPFPGDSIMRVDSVMLEQLQKLGTTVAVRGVLVKQLSRIPDEALPLHLKGVVLQPGTRIGFIKPLGGQHQNMVASDLTELLMALSGKAQEALTPDDLHNMAGPSSPYRGAVILVQSFHHYSKADRNQDGSPKAGAKGSVISKPKRALSENDLKQLLTDEEFFHLTGRAKQ